MMNGFKRILIYFACGIVSTAVSAEPISNINQCQKLSETLEINLLKLSVSTDVYNSLSGDIVNFKKVCENEEFDKAETLHFDIEYQINRSKS